MRTIEILRKLVVILWALALAALVPVFFYNYAGPWLNRVAELWPLSHP